jgi:hypothetical protein
MHSTRHRPAFILAVGLALLGLVPAPARADNETDTWLTSERVSIASDGTEGNGDSWGPVLSHDGSVVVFTSWASNLVLADTNDADDIFHHDRVSGVTRRVSVASDGAQANGQSSVDDLSSDGRFLLFSSDASNLVANDTNGVRDVFRRDLVTSETIRVSLAVDGSELNNASWDGSISDDGNMVAFVSGATNVGVPVLDPYFELGSELYVRDLAAATTRRADQAPLAGGDFTEYISRNGYISGDGTLALVVLTGQADILFTFSAGYLLDLATGDNVALVGDCPSPNVLSGDASVVVCTAGDNEVDYYHTTYYDIPTGQWTTFGEDHGVGPENYASSISADGNVVGIWARFSHGGLVYDRSQRTVTRVAGSGLVHTPGWSSGVSISGDGMVAAFSGSSPYLVSGDTNLHHDVFLTAWSRVDIGDAFVDDVGSVFESDINWLAAAGITKGCNPPVNTEYCPEQPLTRGQIAALLVRTLNLSDDGGGDLFVDDDGSVFEADIDRLGAAGITKGCNPPVNDRFCPNDILTRGEFAALMTRVAFPTYRSPNDFVDTEDSIFKEEISSLRREGITQGCNPPVNDRFCPDDPVTRGQLAAFFRRAFVAPTLPDSAIP